MTAKDGGAAFPGCVRDNNRALTRNPGLSLRDWFAGQALAMIKTNDIESTLPNIAASAYAIADAMLAARNTTNINKENEE